MSKRNSVIDLVEQIKDNWFLADSSHEMREHERDEVIAKIRRMTAENARLREALTNISEGNYSGASGDALLGGFHFAEGLQDLARAALIQETQHDI